MWTSVTKFLNEIKRICFHFQSLNTSDFLQVASLKTFCYKVFCYSWCQREFLLLLVQATEIFRVGWQLSPTTRLSTWKMWHGSSQCMRVSRFCAILYKINDKRMRLHPALREKHLAPIVTLPQSVLCNLHPRLLRLQTFLSLSLHYNALRHGITVLCIHVYVAS